MTNDKHVHVCEECWKKSIKTDGRCAGHEHCGRKTYCCKNVKVSKWSGHLEKTFNEKEYIEHIEKYGPKNSDSVSFRPL